MSIVATRPAFAVWACVLAAFCLAEQPAAAQSGPMSYWSPNWIGFGGNLDAGQEASGSFSDLGGASGFGSTRYQFSNGWFVGGQRAGSAFGLPVSGFNQASSFGSFDSQSMQFGYAFKNAPVSVYAGFDTLKYNSGLGSAFSSFDAMSGTVSGYSAHAGVEFKPASNLSLSLGVGFTQSGRVDSDSRSPSLSNARSSTLSAVDADGSQRKAAGQGLTERPFDELN